MFIAIEIMRSFFRGKDAGEVIKVETFGSKLFTTHFIFSDRIQVDEDAPVSSEDAINNTHTIGVVAVHPVVVRTAALIGAEFLVDPSFEVHPAFEALFFGNCWHITIRL